MYRYNSNALTFRKLEEENVELQKDLECSQLVAVALQEDLERSQASTIELNESLRRLQEDREHAQSAVQTGYRNEYQILVRQNIELVKTQEDLLEENEDLADQVRVLKEIAEDSQDQHDWDRYTYYEFTDQITDLLEENKDLRIQVDNLVRMGYTDTPVSKQF